MGGVTSVADLLKQYRAAAGLTQEELADRAGLSTRAISDLERGIKQHPYPHTVRRLVQALDLDEVQAADFQRASRAVGEANAALGASADVVRGSSSFPIPPTALIGRQHEVQEIRTLLGRDEVRLLTLTGPGGVGKTRLALRMAEEVAPRFPDGAVFVSLASLAWIIHENIYRNGLAADGGFRRSQNPLWLPKSVLEPIQRPKRMNMQLNVAELIRQKCS